jgi:protein TonB
VAIVTSVLTYATRRPAPLPAELPPPSQEAVPPRVFLPPPAVLRELAATPPPAPPPPATLAPAPPAPSRKDRISIGDASAGKTDKPIVLRPDQDLAAAPAERPARHTTAPSPAASAPPPQPIPQPSTAPPDPGSRPGLELPAGAGAVGRGDNRPAPRPGQTPAPAASAPSLASSLRNLEERLAAGKVGPERATAGRQMGPLFFDEAGADFTAWINHFSDEVYRNWIVPQAALLGLRGHVDITFTVDRGGAITRLNVLKSSGTPALDRAAVNALRGSRFLPLPADYGPPEVTMEVTFFYGEGPRG